MVSTRRRSGRLANLATSGGDADVHTKTTKTKTTPKKKTPVKKNTKTPVVTVYDTGDGTLRRRSARIKGVKQPENGEDVAEISNDSDLPAIAKKTKKQNGKGNDKKVKANPKEEDVEENGNDPPEGEEKKEMGEEEELERDGEEKREKVEKKPKELPADGDDSKDDNLDDHMESFDNSSDDDEKEDLSINPSATSSESTRVSADKRVSRRKSAQQARKRLAVEVGTDESSSDVDTSSDEKEFEKQLKAASPASSSDSISMAEDSDVSIEGDDSSDEFFAPSSKKTENKKKETPVRRKSGSQKKSPSSSSTSRSSNGRTSRNGKQPAGSSLPRTAVPKKPAKPWQLAPPAKVGDIEVPQRALRKGEKKMLQFRLLADDLAVNRPMEMTMEESSELVSDMKKKAEEKKRERLEEMMGVETIEKEKREDESSSEDEWEDMERVDGVDGDIRVEVTIDKQAEEVDWWAVYLRQEVNKRVRENWENTHKAHLLCYIAHLQHLRIVLRSDENLVPSLILTILPPALSSLIGEPMTVKNAQKVIVWFSSTFKPSLCDITVSSEVIASGHHRFPDTARFAKMVEMKAFETDTDRAALLFCVFLSLECLSRICVNALVIPRKWDEALLKELSKSSGGDKKQRIAQTCEESEVTSPKETANGAEKGKKSKKTSTPPSKKKKAREESNYWVEVWMGREKRWLAVDPSSSTVDDSLSIESTATQPISYVLAIDSEGGVRDVTSRYASDFVRPEMRRRRTDAPWIQRTLNKPMIRADKARAELEDIHLRTEMVKKPLPTTMSEYKNHPLYVLEKDLLKFEAIYPAPSDQTPLGEIRGHKVYPRDTVYTLQGEKTWEKLARTIKAGEKAYKVVKARPNFRIPADQREQKYLDVFGYWQTEPFKRLHVVNGRIPRNEYGNVNMYQPSMCPIGATHLRLPGLPMIARRIRKECVPAIIGWDFHSCSNYPIVEGACVLDEDVDIFLEEWKKTEAGKEEKQAKKREERILSNWRRLIRGIVRLQFVRNKFGSVEGGAKGGAKKKGSKSAPSTSSSASALPSSQNDSSNSSSAILDLTGQNGGGARKKAEFTLEDMMQF